MAGGAGGRPRKPSAIHARNGNPGKRKLRDEPAFERGVPPCPEGLSLRAQAAWQRVGKHLNDVGVITLADGAALELLVVAYDEFYEAARILDEAGGPTYETQSVTGGRMIKVHPAAALRNDAWRRLSAMLVQFGLTPASRSKVSPVAEREEDPFDAFLKGGTNGASASKRRA